MTITITMWRFLGYGAFTGFLVPMMIVLLNLFQYTYVALALWPTSFFLMAIHSEIPTPTDALILAISIGINVALYAMLAALVYAGWEFIRWVRSKPFTLGGGK